MFYSAFRSQSGKTSSQSLLHAESARQLLYAIRSSTHSSDVSAQASVHSPTVGQLRQSGPEEHRRSHAARSCSCNPSWPPCSSSRTATPPHEVTNPSTSASCHIAVTLPHASRAREHARAPTSVVGDTHAALIAEPAMASSRRPPPERWCTPRDSGTSHCTRSTS